MRRGCTRCTTSSSRVRCAVALPIAGVHCSEPRFHGPDLFGCQATSCALFSHPCRPDGATSRCARLLVRLQQCRGLRVRPTDPPRTDPTPHARFLQWCCSTTPACLTCCLTTATSWTSWGPWSTSRVSPAGQQPAGCCWPVGGERFEARRQGARAVRLRPVVEYQLAAPALADCVLPSPCLRCPALALQTSSPTSGRSTGSSCRARWAAAAACQGAAGTALACRWGALGAHSQPVCKQAWW